MEQEYIGNFIINKDENNKILGFEAVSGADAYETISDIIKYLKEQQLDFVYYLNIDDCKVGISRFCNPDIVLHDYYLKTGYYSKGGAL